MTTRYPTGRSFPTIFLEQKKLLYHEVVHDQGVFQRNHMLNLYGRDKKERLRFLAQVPFKFPEKEERVKSKLEETIKKALGNTSAELPSKFYFMATGLSSQYTMYTIKRHRRFGGKIFKNDITFSGIYERATK